MTISDILNAGFGFTDDDLNDEGTVLAKAFANMIGSVNLITVLSFGLSGTDWLVLMQEVMHLPGVNHKDDYPVESYAHQVKTIDELREVILNFRDNLLAKP